MANMFMLLTKDQSSPEILIFAFYQAVEAAFLKHNVVIGLLGPARKLADPKIRAELENTEVGRTIYKYIDKAKDLGVEIYICTMPNQIYTLHTRQHAFHIDGAVNAFTLNEYILQKQYTILTY